MKIISKFLTGVFIAATLIGCSGGGSGSSSDDDQAVDSTPPQVTSTTPLDASTGVSLNPSISAVFNENILGTTVNGTSFTLTEGGNPVSGTVAFSATTNTTTFTPSGPLMELTTYTATLKNTITDLSGNALSADHVWTFTTLDNTPPQVSSTTPLDASTGVSLNPSISAVFNENILGTTVNGTSFTLTEGGNPVSGTVAFSATTNTTTFTPSGPLMELTTYTATLKNTITDLSGNALSADHVWTFTTLDNTPPQVSSTTPLDASTGVSLNTSISAVFNENILDTTVNGTSFTLTEGGNPVSGTVAFNATTNTATFTPSIPLAELTTYTATLANTITDLNSNPLAADFIWSFTTGAFPPQVISTSPTDGEINVPLSSTVTATFNEDIAAGTIDNSSFFLTQNGIQVTGAASIGGTSTSAIFTPATPLALLAPYTATLTTAITDLGGTPMSANQNWSFTTIDGNWGSSGVIELDDTGNARVPQARFDKDGNALAVWQQKISTEANINIYASRYTSSGGWEAPIRISDGNGDAYNPQIDIDGNGNAIVVWHQLDTIRNNIWSNRYTSGTTSWGTAELIEADDTDNALYPQIVIDTSGDALVVWQQSDGVRDNIWANRYTAATTSWGLATTIESDNTGNAQNPQIAIDSNNNAFAVWQQAASSESNVNIHANRFLSTSGWGTPIPVSDDSGDAQNPQISMDSDGNAITVWQEDDTIRENIRANHYDIASDSWDTATTIESATETAQNPTIAIDNAGNGLAIWFQTNGSVDSIYANHFDLAGNQWSSPVLIDSDNAGVEINMPGIAMDPNGNAFAIYYLHDTSRYITYAKRYSATDGWSPSPSIVSDTSPSSLIGSINAELCIDPKGAALAVWQQHDGAIFSIWGNQFR